MNPSQLELLATILFAVAVLHTFLVKQFEAIAHKFPAGSVGENIFHLLAEVEVVFGFWATVFLVAIAVSLGGETALGYIEGRHVLPGGTDPIKVEFTEPLFVFVIMAMAATRPILVLVKGVIGGASRVLPFPPSMAFYVATLVMGPLLGSFITEPAAMTVTALLLKERFYDRGLSSKLMYATLGLLFVNISIGGTLTNFAAPPVVMVAGKWEFSTAFMLTQFGWKAAAAIFTATFATAILFRRELAELDDRPAPAPAADGPLDAPWWLIGLHVALISGVVLLMHHPVAFFGIFLFFLGLATATKEYQDAIKLREALLVAYFLMGLVVFGALQKWWLQPTISSMSELPLYFGATGLTAITDNAALTFLGSQVEGLSDASKYMLVAGAVTGGGLTVIANAPNPAGYGILKGSFGASGISPLGLLVAATPATILAILAFLLLPNL